MTILSSASYHCALCNQVRLLAVDKEDHQKRVMKSPNGLSTYSDIHYCFDGMLSINNLHIDRNYAVRSFSLMELPDKKVDNHNSMPGIPMPSAITAAVNKYVISKMREDDGYRLILLDKDLNVQMNIGEVIPGKEEVIETIESEEGTVILDYYPSPVQIRKSHRKWFKALVDALEVLPPTRLGLFIEALRYVYEHHNTLPSDFEIEQLHTLLSSHKTWFTLAPGPKYKKLRNITSKYGEDKRKIMDQIIELLNTDPAITLQSFVNKLKIDLVYLIYLFLIMEQSGLLIIHRFNE